MTKNRDGLINKARYKVVSLRVSDGELKRLDALTADNDKSISDVMREALTFYSSHSRRP